MTQIDKEIFRPALCVGRRRTAVIGFPAETLALVGAASCDTELPVLFNTNRPLTSTVPAGFVVHRGWWFDKHSAADLKKDWQRTRNSTNGYMHFDAYVRPKVRELPMVYKHAWLATLDRRQLPGPWLVFDTDTIVQCRPSEFRARFRRFGTPLVVGAEEQWWPDPHRSINPAPTCATQTRDS